MPDDANEFSPSSFPTIFFGDPKNVKWCEEFVLKRFDELFTELDRAAKEHGMIEFRLGRWPCRRRLWLGRYGWDLECRNGTYISDRENRRRYRPVWPKTEAGAWPTLPDILFLLRHWKQLTRQVQRCIDHRRAVALAAINRLPGQRGYQPAAPIDWRTLMPPTEGSGVIAPDKMVPAPLDSFLKPARKKNDGDGASCPRCHTCGSKFPWSEATCSGCAALRTCDPTNEVSTSTPSGLVNQDGTMLVACISCGKAHRMTFGGSSYCSDCQAKLQQCISDWGQVKGPSPGEPVKSIRPAPEGNEWWTKPDARLICTACCKPTQTQVESDAKLCGECLRRVYNDEPTWNWTTPQLSLSAAIARIAPRVAARTRLELCSDCTGVPGTAGVPGAHGCTTCNGAGVVIVDKAAPIATAKIAIDITKLLDLNTLFVEAGATWLTKEAGVKRDGDDLYIELSLLRRYNHASGFLS